MVEDDGLDYFYLFTDIDGNKVHLLSNNLSVKDRVAMDALYHEQARTNKLAWLCGTYLGYETAMRVK